MGTKALTINLEDPYVSADIRCDRLPGISSFTNSLGLFLKFVSTALDHASPGAIDSHRIFVHLKKKPLQRMLTLIFFPGFGNYHYYREDRKRDADHFYKHGIELNQTNLGLGIESFKKASDLGSWEASFDLYSFYKPTSPETSMAYLLKSASQGNSKAYNFLGIECMALGKGVEAIKYFEMACDFGFGPAFCNLGRCYTLGIDVKPDENEAKKLFLKAAQNNDPNGILELYMSFGVTVIEGEEQIISPKIIFQNAFVNGILAGVKGYVQGLCYLGGIGTLKDENKAFNTFKECIEKNNVQNQILHSRAITFSYFCSILLGICYLKGKGTPVDLERSYACLSRINEQEESLVKILKHTFYNSEDAAIKKSLLDAFCDCCCNVGSELLDSNATNEDRLSEKNKMAVILFKKASHLNHNESRMILGICYKLGLGVQQDVNVTINILTDLKNTTHDPRILHELGVVLYESDEKRKDEAIRMLSEAANSGYVESYLNLGFCYSAESKHEQAKECYLKAAQMGNLLALLYLYVDYDQIPQLTNSFEGDAKKLWAVLNHNDIKDKEEAFYARGRCLRFGIGTPINYSASFQQFLEGAQKGHLRSYVEAGKCYKWGLGVNENKDQAIKYFEWAVKEEDPEACFQYGLCYLQGYEVVKTPVTFFVYIQKAAELGYIPALEELVTCYQNGIGCKQSSQESAQTLKIALDRGSSRCLVKDIIVEGLSPKDDQDESRKKMFLKLKEETGRGNAYALFCFGSLCEQGIGTTKNIKGAKQAYIRAADLGNPEACYTVYKHYLIGVCGFEKNAEKAEFYRLRALSLGIEEAKIKSKTVNKVDFKDLFHFFFKKWI